MKLRFVNLLASFFIVAASSAQQKFTFHGYVRDGLSGETLIGASLTIKGSGTGINTNQYGFYSLTLEKGSYYLITSFIGYQSMEIAISLDKDQQVNLDLFPQSALMNNVTVTVRKRESNVKAAQEGSAANGNLQVQAKQVSLFPVIPSVNYNLHF